MNKTFYSYHKFIMDKFYTLPSYSKKCIDKVGEIYGDYSQWRLVIEPSAGNGSFLSTNTYSKKSRYGH